MVQAGILKDWTKASSAEQYLLYMISWSYSAPPWKIQGRVECKYGKVGRDLTCEAGKEEGEEEEAVEMSVTEDPAGMTLPEFAEASNTDLFILFFSCFFCVSVFPGSCVDTQRA